MDVFLEKLKANWEVCVVGLALLVTLSILVSHFVFVDDDGVNALHASGSMEFKSTLSPGAFDFLKQNSSSVEANPFKLPIAAPEPPRPQPKPQPKPVEKPKPKLEMPPMETVAEPEPPKPEMQVAKLQFVLQGSNSSARTMAVVKFTMADGKASNVKLGIGETKYGVKVLDIASDEMQIQDAKSNKIRISKGATRKLWIKEAN